MREETPRQREARRRRQKLLRQRQVRRQKILLATGTVAAAGIVAIAAGISSFLHSRAERATQETAAQQEALLQEQQAAEEEKQRQEEEANTIHLLAVGDNLIHEKIYESGIQTDGTWNYDHLYTHVKDRIAQADLAAVNQECIFVSDHDNVSAYPTFGSPMEVGDALVNAGFDIVESASNHTFDKGAQAITDTIQYWQTNHPEISLLGIHDSQEAADTISTVTVKGVTFALLNYTSLINGDAYDQFPSYMIDLLRAERVTEDVQKASQMSDMTIAFLHTGEEYSREPNQEQKNFLQLLLSQGVDIAICSHPHVLQNFETLRDDQGNEMLVYYSLGNFISTQKEPECMLGGMADITITVDDGSGNPAVTGSDLIPLVTHYNYDANEYTVYPLEDYTEELAASHSIHQETTETFSLEYLQQTYQSVLKQTYDTLGTGGDTSGSGQSLT